MVFAIAGGLCLLLVMLAAWQSVRRLLVDPRELAGQSVALDEPGKRELMREKESLLAAIRELRFEHDLGKLSDADLAQLEQGYRGRAREVLRELDEELEPHRNAARALIEAARSPAAPQASEPAEATAKVESEAEIESKAATGAPSCGACGARNDADARFCKKCGGKLGAEAGA